MLHVSHTYTQVLKSIEHIVTWVNISLGYSNATVKFLGSQLITQKTTLQAMPYSIISPWF